MGTWFSAEIFYATANLKRNDDCPGLPLNESKGVQVDIRSHVSHEGTQTPVTFTDRLSAFGDKEVGSTEAFDHACDICETLDKEAVGYCKQCEQYYCFKCCRCHEKVRSCQRHNVVDKDNFPDKGTCNSYNPLSERPLVPASVNSIPDGYTNRGIHTDSYIRCIAFFESAGHTVALDSNTGLLAYLKVIEKDGNITKAYLSYTYFHMILCLSGANHEVLLTLPDKQEVQKCKIDTQSVTPVTYFKTAGDCYGIAEFDDGFAVSIRLVTGYSLPDWQVQYLDKKGKIKKQIYYDNHNKPLFSKPEYLASNYAQDVLYVSDIGADAIIALNKRGSVLFTFSHSDMRSPMAMTVDDEDNVYVACGDNVVQIHNNGTKHRVLIQKNKDKPDILSVCFNPISRALIVGEDSNKVKTFNFLP